MPSRSLVERLRDMLTEIEEVQAMLTDLTFTEFCQDCRTTKAVLYGLAVIGEAAASLLPEIKENYPQVPWQQIRGMRNITIHEYFRVDLGIIWETVRTDLPRLAIELRQILAEIEAG